MSKKSFSESRKPVRPPSPEQIAAFEETGRAIAREQRISAKAEARKHRKPETSEHVRTDNLEHANTDCLKSSDTDTHNHGDTETQKLEPNVRLTIDLPESTHTRFKAVCAITRRKMVDEVRGFIERRTAELEDEGRQPR